MAPVPQSGRLLAMIDAVTELSAVAIDTQALAEVVAKSLAHLDGATGAAARISADGESVMAVCDPALERLDTRGLFSLLHVEGCDGSAARILNIRSMIAAPLPFRDQCMGMLWVYSSHAAAFREEDPALVERFAKIVGSIAHLSLQFNAKLRESRTDDLTGLQNRRAYDESLRQALAEATRYDTPLTLVIADLNAFKAINDRFGHLKGDVALSGVAHILRRLVRATDSVFRIGGDEFAILMPQSHEGAARKLMTRVARRLSAARFDFGRISLSYGISEMEANDDPLSLHERADRALYANKHARTA
jgi:diguanylate cyclase (GGDEF)-like protein